MAAVFPRRKETMASKKEKLDLEDENSRPPWEVKVRFKTLASPAARPFPFLMRRGPGRLSLAL